MYHTMKVQLYYELLISKDRNKRTISFRWRISFNRWTNYFYPL